MNSKLNAIFSRRSIRKYGKGEIPDEAVKDLLDAAMAAPSAVCKDPWHFIVVRDKAMLAKMAEGLPNGKMLADAGVGIVVCGELGRAHGQELSYLLQDCSAAIENILLAVNMLGLGACWLGVHPRMERVAHLQQVLGIPENVTPISVISIGQPAETPPARTRYNASLVHNEKW